MLIYNFFIIKYKINVNCLADIKNDAIRIFDLNINLLILSGVFMIIIGVIPIIRRKIKEGKYTREVNAKIIDIEETIFTDPNSSMEKVRYRPVYEYIVDGTTYKNYDIFVDKPDFKIGDKKIIMCDPENPKNFIGFSNNIYWIILIIIGIIVVLLGILL